LYGTNRPTPYSDWRQNVNDYSIAAEGLTNLGDQALINATGFENVLGSSGAPALALGTASYFVPLGLYAGPVNYDIAAGNFALAGTTTLCSIEYMNSGDLLHGRQEYNVIWDDGNALSAAANVSVRGSTIFPRAAVALVLMGNQTSGDEATLTWSFQAQQAA
jgi:hypothetical protein